MSACNELKPLKIDHKPIKFQTLSRCDRMSSSSRRSTHDSNLTLKGLRATVERIRPVAHLSPSPASRIAGQPVKVGMLVCFIFRLTSSSETPRAFADFDARKAAALRLNHLKMARLAWQTGAGSRS